MPLVSRLTCDTPVKIEYERVKVRIDASGKASIGIYPDVYGRQKITLASVKQALVSAGLDGLVEDTFLKSLIQAVPDRQIEFAQTHKLKINGTMRIEHIISIAGDKQIPVMALADSLNTSVNWDENQQIVSRQNKMAPGKKRGNSVYISVEYLPTLFGGREV
ncbi:MAG: L,D-transpeptidase catalytic domain, partial [Firmicutes bacterium]|nr:L,D-transpeptidase catalytic domain [Bacillota bacterium]